MPGEKLTSLEKQVRALEAIGSSPNGLTLTEIAQRCSVPLATAHRIIYTLQQSGLVAATPGKRKDYTLGSRLLRLLHAGTDEAFLRIAVQPLLDSLTEKLEETCFVAQLSGDRIVSIARAVPAKGLRGYVVPGHMMPLHAAASAKAILAFQPKDILDRILRNPLPRLTPETIHDVNDLLREFEDVRELGYATCWNEMEIGIGALAVPIRVPNLGVMYSLGVSGLIDRLQAISQTQLIEDLLATADDLAVALRHPTLQQPA